MSGVARMLLTENVRVTGSDMHNGQVVTLLREMGATVSVGHDPSNLPADARMVIISAAIKESNPELAEARRRGVEVVKYAKALGLLMAEKTGVAVSGTHGKTTTTAMTAMILCRAGLDPSFVVGGFVPDLGTSSAEGRGDVFVAEACEYDRSFLNLRPRISVITNIEEDHLDYYKDLAEIVGAFKDFTALLPEGRAPPRERARQKRRQRRRNGPVQGREVRGEGPCRLAGREPYADARALHASTSCITARSSAASSLAIPGVHNVLNALAATAVAHAVGVDFEAIQSALADFHGAARRMQSVGEAQGVAIIDDYAHHPTEIQVTLKALRDFYKPERLWVIFQPHQHSRTRFFLKDFAGSLSLADKIIVPDIYFVRDSEQERTAVEAGDLVRECVGRGYDAEYLAQWPAIVERIAAEAGRGDVVVTMGAGNVYEVAYALLERLQRNM